MTGRNAAADSMEAVSVSTHELPGELSRRYICWLLGGVVAIGIVVRLYVAEALDGKAFNDTAIVGLMAMHELAGRFYAFYWGQSYMGSTESLSIAPFFALFGVNEFSLSFGLLPWSVLFTIAVYQLTRLCGGDRAAAIAALLSAVAPAYLLYHEMMPLGGYPETLALGTLLLWLTLRLVYRPWSARAQGAHLVAIGAIAGFAFWTNWLVLPYFAVVGFYLALWDRRLLGRLSSWLALGAFVLASLPFWTYNLGNHFATFHLLSRGAVLSGSKGRGADLGWVLTRGVPAVLGVRDLDGAFAGGIIGLALAAVVAAATIAALIRLRPSWLALASGRVREAKPVASLFVFALVTAVVYVECRPTTLRLERYLVPFATATIPLSAMAIDRLFSRRRLAGAATLVLLLSLYAQGAWDLHQHFVNAPSRFFAGRVEELSRYLVGSPIRFAYAEYGDAMITTFLARDRVVVTDYQNRRYPIDEQNVENPAVILYDGAGSGAEGTLRSLDTKYERARVAGYRVYWPIHYDGVARAALGREGWKISATTDAEDADLMLDGDLLTRWSAAADESSHPSLRLDLGRDQTISGVYLDLGGQPNAAFRHLLVETSRDGESWELAKDASWDFPISFRPDGQVSVMPDDVQMVLFAPRPARWLRLTLLEAFPGQIWTVAELDVFGQASAGSSIFQPPVFADPTSFEVAEHRLRREIDRHPETNAALLELRELYRTHGQPDRAAAIDRIQTERFSPTVALGWRFGAALELLGYDRKSSGPRELEITYYWKARSRMDADYAASVHVRGSQGHFQSDYVLGPADHPTRSWQPQEIVKQTERLTLPEELPSGVYDVHVGVWNPSDHHHLLLGPWWHHAKTAPLLEGVRAPQPAEPVSSRRS
jgi:hypothetical protein